MLPFLVRDAASHSATISYTDSFSDNINRGTLAYPTTITDADNFSSTIKYHYDIGAVTRTQDPKGAVETTEYDNVGRLQRITNQFTTGYSRWEYPLTGEIVSFTKVDPSQPETSSVQYTDGAGRVRGVISQPPGSSGQWRASRVVYDIMGRLKEQTNPTEVTSAWCPPETMPVDGFDENGRHFQVPEQWKAGALRQLLYSSKVKNQIR